MGLQTKKTRSTRPRFRFYYYNENGCCEYGCWDRMVYLTLGYMCFRYLIANLINGIFDIDETNIGKVCCLVWLLRCVQDVTLRDDVHFFVV